MIPPGGASEPESATSSARRELTEVTYRVAEEEKLEDVTRKRSREKGSKVTPQGESAAGRVEGRQRMRALDKECGGVQRGVDAGAMHRHYSEVYAATSRRTRMSRIKTLNTHIDTYTDTHIHAHTHTCTQTHPYTHMHTHIHTYTHTYTHIYTHIHTYTHIHVHTYTHTHMHTYTHVDT